VNKLRECGGIINSRIVIAAARGYISAENVNLLSENGGPIELSKPWATSFMTRMGLTKRKGTKGVKKLPEGFDATQTTFLGRICDVVKKYNIPPNLIIDWDQTGSYFVPVSSWTMAEKGAKQVGHLSYKLQYYYWFYN